MRAQIVLAVWTMLWLTSLASAQDFRVSTKLYDELSEKNANDPVAHSWSIFHAGKVYDHVDVVGETTVFDPAQKRFLILHPRRMIATVLAFDDIDQELYKSMRKAEQRVKNDPANTNTSAIAFQLTPAFQESYDQSGKKLLLSSPHFRYEVRTATTDEDRRTAYLRYADWAAKLNYVLHPQLLPNPRLKLNTALEKHKVLPTEIRLTSKIGNGLQLRAEHKFQWELTAQDRRQISDAESILQNPQLKMLEFDDFQDSLAAR